MTYESGGGQSLANPSIDVIARVLSVHQATVLPLDGRRHAAVALLLRPTPGGPEMLFIERAECDGDPWSGDLGFPGGKVEPADASSRQAAEREVREEIGVALEQALYLGRLDDISGAHLPIIVSCFVWSVPPDPLLMLSEEAVSALWVPLPLLLD
ncbi:MAG: CoA pyrophosphatase, partial [Desulfuromonadales bacterium]|nr:CoA pyrophosphatase [Desulfuromonadales bacterium]